MTRSEQIKAAYDSWGENRGKNPEIWDQIFAPDFEFRTALGAMPGTNFRRTYSAGDISDYFQTLDETFEMKALQPGPVVEGDDMVVMIWDAEWVNRASGQPFRCEIACVWEFEGDRAVSYREIFDIDDVVRTFA